MTIQIKNWKTQDLFEEYYELFTEKFITEQSEITENEIEEFDMCDKQIDVKIESQSFIDGLHTFTLHIEQEKVLEYISAFYCNAVWRNVKDINEKMAKYTSIPTLYRFSLNFESSYVKLLKVDFSVDNPEAENHFGFDFANFDGVKLNIDVCINYDKFKHTSEFDSFFDRLNFNEINKDYNKYLKIAYALEQQQRNEKNA